MAIKKPLKPKSRGERKAKDFIDLAFSNSMADTRWIKTANRLLDWFYGRFHTKTERRKRFTVNMTFSLVNLILPNFIIHQPHIRVSPKQPRYYRGVGETPEHPEGIEQIDNIKASRTMEAVVNNHYDRFDIILEDRKCIQDALFYPFGVIKNGLSFIEDMDGNVVEDKIFRKRINPRDFGWHPLATNVEDSPMLTHRSVFTKHFLKNRFGRSLDDVKSEIPEHLKKKFDKKNSKSLLSDLVTIYEVHDQEKGMIYTYAGDERILLEKKENQFDFNGSHFDMIKFAGDNDEFMGIPMLEMVEDEIVALNDAVTLIVEHFRKFAGMVFIEHGAADEDDIERIRNSEQGSIHLIKDITKIQFTSPLRMGSEYFSIVNLLQNLIDTVLGVPDFKRLAGTGRKSATESTFIQGDATVRKNYFLDIVKRFVLSGVRKQASLKQQFMDQKEVIKASGELNFETFEATKDDIQGEFMFDFDVDNMAAMNEAQLNNIINILNVQASHPSLHSSLRNMNSDKLTRRLYKLAGLNVESFVNEEIEEVVHVSPERENQIALKGDLMPRPKKDEDHKAHLEIHLSEIEDRIRQLGPERAQADFATRQMLEHVAETQALMQQKSLSGQLVQEQQQQQPAPETGVQTQPEAMQPGGPTGPLQSVAG